jgi:hypothetical protein
MLRLLYFLDNWFTHGDEIVSLKRRPLFTAKKYFLVVVSVRGCVNTRATVRLKGLDKLKQN